MEALEVKGFSKAFQTDKELTLTRRWNNFIIYIIPLALSLYLGVSIIYILPVMFDLTGLKKIAVITGSIIVFTLPLLYLGLCGLLNTITLKFNSQGIRLENKPIHWFLSPNQFIPKSDISQILVKEVVHKTVPIYLLIIQLKTGKEIIIQSYGLYFGEKAAYYANDTANLILKYV
ncbi:MAG: hypothetical protein MUC49_18660 [Raineya sp.]|jgi:hypothetical protein|nr:hypothetical protein [Raineya sp.]